MQQPPNRACKRTKSKQKQNQVTSHLSWPRALLFDSAQKQCNGIIKGWLHCLTSELKGRFLVNNILIFVSAWCLVTAQIQFALKKKKKIGRPEHCLTTNPPHLRPITSHFYLTPNPHSKWTSCVYHPLNDCRRNSNLVKWMSIRLQTK